MLVTLRKPVKTQTAHVSTPQTFPSKAGNSAPHSVTINERGVTKF